jgi:hypothetical protein
MASMACGEPRSTLDVDVVVELPSWKVAEFCAAFPGPDFYVDERTAMEAAQGPGQFDIKYVTEGVKANIIVFSDTPFNELRLSRVRRVELPGSGAVMVSAPEDVILKKLEFFKEGGSDKHLRDIASMYKTTGSTMDLAYLDHWSLRIGVWAQWRMMKERLGIK